MSTHTEPKRLLKREKLEIIDWLIETFPAAFFKKSKHIKPLKVGILEDIFQAYQKLEKKPFSKRSLRTAITYYCTSPAYLSAQKTGEARLDLYGNEMDIVTAEQARYAKQRYKTQYLSIPSQPSDSSHLIHSKLDVLCE